MTPTLSRRLCREMLSSGETTLYLLPKNAEDHTKRSPIGPYDPAILCRACEDRFQQLDDYAARLLIQERDIAFRESAVGEHRLYIADNFDYARLKLFILSVLWRAAVSKIPFCGRVHLGPRLARVRQMLEALDPGLPLEFATFFTRWIQPPDKKLPPKFLASPVSRRYEEARVIRLYLGYFVAEVCTSSASLRPPLSDFVIAPGRPLVAIALTLSGSSDVTAFNRAILKRGAMRRKKAK